VNIEGRKLSLIKPSDPFGAGGTASAGALRSRGGFKDPNE